MVDPIEPQLWERCLVGESATLRDTIAAIEAGGRQIALVVDGERRLIGTVTDGDIRRGVLQGARLEDNIVQVMNRHPRTVGPNMPRHAMLKLMSEFNLHQLPILDNERRVIGLEQIDTLVESPIDETWVILMAGGLGTRLHPITKTVPKPMIPVGGRPLIENIITSFSAQGFRHFFLSVNYRADLIRGHFGNGEDFGVSITYLEESERKGTAGALSLLPERPTGPIIVMNGDVLTTVNFRQLLDFHRHHRAVATMCVREYAFEIPFGVIETDDYRLKGLVEKPLRTALVNAGIYAMSPEALDLIPAEGIYDMTELFSDLVSSNHETIVFPIHEYWLDVGRMEDLDRASNDYTKVFE